MPSYNDALREEIIAILKSNDIAFKPFGAFRTQVGSAATACPADVLVHRRACG